MIILEESHNEIQPLQISSTVDASFQNYAIKVFSTVSNNFQQLIIRIYMIQNSHFFDLKNNTFLCKSLEKPCNILAKEMALKQNFQNIMSQLHFKDASLHFLGSFHHFEQTHDSCMVLWHLEHNQTRESLFDLGFREFGQEKPLHSVPNARFDLHA